MTALSLMTIGIAVPGLLKSSNALIPIISMVVGTIIGELLDIDSAVTKLGETLQKRFSGSTVTEGFVTGSLVFRLVIGVMVVIALTCFATITLKTATSSVLGDTRSIESSMSTMKSDSTTLEVQNSALSSTATIKAHAEKIGMSAPYEVGTIVLQKDVVATDAQGALSLSGSIKNAAEIQG